MEKRSFESSEFVEFIEFVEFGDDETGDGKTGSGKNENAPLEPDKERDLRPEFCHYRDEGCELAESCLNCPFARCIYEQPGGKRRWLKRLRAREIARLHNNEGKKVEELAEMFDVSERTVQRALRTQRA